MFLNQSPSHINQTKNTVFSVKERLHWEFKPKGEALQASGYPSYIMRALFDDINQSNFFKEKITIFTLWNGT